jgi:carbamoyltransferase
MNIIGVSGLEGAVPFKKAHWPGLPEREYRMSQGHDSAAVLVVDGNIIAAAAEERFNRQKHSARFPFHAIRFCLEQGGLRLEDVDEIAHCFDYTPYKNAYALHPVSSLLYRDVYSREALLELVRRDLPHLPAERVVSVDHHLAHAASAYHTSGWDECLVVIADGMGEAHGITVYHAGGGHLKRLASMSANDSIGILYSLITYHLGFDFNSDEYKIMGLAPYGDPSHYRAFFASQVQLRPDGTLQIPLLHGNSTREDRENYTASRQFLAGNLIPARDPDDEISDAHRDVAAALQECLDRVMLHVCGHFAKTTGLHRLALAGGVALNCTANGHLVKSGVFEDIYIQPAAGDDGAALGAALHRSAHAREVRNVRMPVPYLGPTFCDEEIAAALRECPAGIETIQFRTYEETAAAAARLIADGRVLAWYRGAMEFGPRALGHRSILADPGHPEMRDRINAMVKMREAFRPFAPAVTIEQVDHWFDVPPRTELPYMITIVDVREAYRAQLPAITHVNGTARVQTVSAESDAEFHQLLRAVGKSTGREMVLNTSFNVKGQPIVNTPREAMATFLTTGIDVLFLGNVKVARRASRGATEKPAEAIARA